MTTMNTPQRHTLRALLASLTLLASAAALLGLTSRAELRGSPYPLATCPVSGKPLGAECVTMVIEDKDNPLLDGREIRFCCAGCTKTFNADRAAMLETIDAEIAAQQRPLYPMVACVVMPEELLPAAGSEDAANIKEVVVLNKLVRLCCKGCIKKLRKDPSKVVAAIDAAVIEKQKAAYPLKECPVSGKPLPAEPTDIVLGERLVRLCCPKCADTARRDTAAVLAKFPAPAAAAAPAGTPSAPPAPPAKD